MCKSESRVLIDADVCASGSILTLRVGEQYYRFHAIWLRDNSPDAATRDPNNGQRLITLADIPIDISISSATIDGAYLVCEFQPEKKCVRFLLKWLVEHAYDLLQSNTDVKIASQTVLWDRKLQKKIPKADINLLESNEKILRKWLHGIREIGFSMISGMRGESEELFRIVDLFGYVRETNYGRYFEVRTEINPINLAYTGLALQAHTDNPYRDPVPTLQILSCIENSVEGGKNMIVDGYSVALKLHKENPVGFDCLVRFPARFSYAGANGVELHSKRSLIELGPDGEIMCIRFNARSIAPLIDVPYDSMECYYNAYKRMSELIDDPEMQVTFILKPGEAFIVDNTRVLHARKSYSGAGNRWLQGCYSERDGLFSKLAALEMAK